MIRNTRIHTAPPIRGKGDGALGRVLKSTSTHPPASPIQGRASDEKDGSPLMATTTPPASTPPGPSRTVKVMALIIAILCGLVAALTAFTLSRHLEATNLQAIAYSGVSFLGVAAFVKAVQEKLGLL